MKRQVLGVLAVAGVLLAGCEPEPDVVVEPGGDVPTPAAAVARVRELRAKGVVPANRTATVRISRGRYPVSEPLTLTPADSGIRFVGDGWQSTVVDGGREIGPFAVNEKGVWVADVPKGFVFEQLWVGDRRAIRARTPNEGQFAYMKDEVHERPVNSFVAFPKDLAVIAKLTPEERAKTMVVYWQSWDMGYAAITGVDVATGRIDTSRSRGRPFFFWDKTCPRYILENYSGALDAPGEWFLDETASKVHYVPRDGEKPGVTKVFAPKLETVLAIAGDAEKGEYVKNVTFEGIGFEFSKLVLGPQGIDNRQAAANVDSAAVMVAGGDGIVFRDCRIAHTGAHGLWIRGGSTRCRVEHSLVEDLGAGGVYFGDQRRELKKTERNSSHLTITDSIVRHGGRILNGAIGVWLGHVNDCNVLHNEICDFYYTGVSLGWTWGYAETTTRRNHIDFNHIHHLGQGVLSDMGGVYSLGNQEGSTVCNNWIHDVNGYRDTGSPAWGLYTDEGSANILLASNLIERCRSGAIHQHYGKENLYANNIFATFDEFGVWRSKQEDHVTIRVMNNVFWWENPKAGTFDCHSTGGPKDLPADGNVYWCTAGEPKGDAYNHASWEKWRKDGKDASGAIADPLFVDPAHGDWRLKPDSSALKHGFKPFDWKRAGVLKADARWAARAAEETWDAFKDATKAPPYCREQASFDCERFAPGPLRNAMGSLAPFRDTQGRQGTLEFVGKDVGGGKRSLKFVELPNLPQSFAPMVALPCRVMDGVAKFVFSVKCEAGSRVQVETRDYDTKKPYLTATRLVFADGKAQVRGKTFAECPLGVWTDVEVVLPLSGPKKGTWTCTVTPRGGQPQVKEFAKLESGEFKNLNWIGFISFGKENSVWYLDDFRLTKE